MNYLALTVDDKQVDKRFNQPASLKIKKKRLFPWDNKVLAWSSQKYYFLNASFKLFPPISQIESPLTNCLDLSTLIPLYSKLLPNSAPLIFTWTIATNILS